MQSVDFFHSKQLYDELCIKLGFLNFLKKIIATFKIFKATAYQHIVIVLLLKLELITTWSQLRNHGSQKGKRSVSFIKEWEAEA